MDAIFVLHQLVEKAVEYEKPLFLCFMNLKQIFDHIKLKNIEVILRKHRVREKIVKVIQEMNTENYTQIKIEHGLSEKIAISKVVKTRRQLKPNIIQRDNRRNHHRRKADRNGLSDGKQ